MPACTRSSCPRCRRWYSPRKRRAPNDTGSDKVCRLTWENLGYDHSFVGDRFDGTWTGFLGGMKASAVIGVEVGRTFWDSPRNEVTSPQVVDPLAPEPTDFFDRGTGRIQDVRAELS